MADRIVVLRLGKVEQVGSPLELYHHYDNRFVAGFTGSPRMNFLDVKLLEGDISQSSVEFSGGDRATLPVNVSRGVAGSVATPGIRPEDLGSAQGDFTLSKAG